jgi:hypothetical protein
VLSGHSRLTQGMAVSTTQADTTSHVAFGTK